MTQSEIRIHCHEEPIHNLLCGRQPRIGTGLRQNRPRTSSNAEYTDFSKFQFPDPIEPAKNRQQPIEENRKPTLDKSKYVPVDQFHKLRQEEASMKEIDEVIQAYETNNRRKNFLRHQEYEEHYLQPLSKKLVKKVNGQQYSEFRQKKTRAVTAFDTQLRKKDSFLDELPTIPNIVFTTNDLNDPIVKYKQHNKKEESLTTFIAKSTGQYTPPPEFPERDTMNLKKWQTLAETRFYGNSNAPVKKGKRLFPDTYKDQIESTMDNFAEPPPRLPTIQRPLSRFGASHIVLE